MSWASIVKRGLPARPHDEIRTESSREIPIQPATELSNNEHPIYDIGVNLASKQLKRELERILSESYQNGVVVIVTISNSLKECYENVALCKKYSGKSNMPKIYTTIGVHPHNASSWNHNVRHQIIELVRDNREFVVAIGECGLDYNRNYSPQAKQVICFEDQIELSNELDLPLYLHERDAHQDMVNVLSKHGLNGKYLVHCFTGDTTALNTYVEMGCYIGITGWVCDDKRGKNLQRAVPHIPIDRLMVETDSPFLKPRSIDTPGRINEPKNVRFVAREISRLMQISENELCSKTIENASRFFGF